MWHSGWGGGGWFLMIMIAILLWGLLTLGIVALGHWLIGAGRGRRNGGPSSGGNGWGDRRAEELLAERFARGEIDEDEYRRRLTLLREHR
ncbi:hypothetical protein [Streptomyces sp. NPDC092952]|uniref:hypothetical protein n=1 Tax=Streptomyces sp. NPDC092952 TaxID=3366018 RepID=UPI0038282AFF